MCASFVCSLPRYQAKQVNIKKEGKAYSYETQMEIRKSKQQHQNNGDDDVHSAESSFLESIAPQLTAKQLETVKTEMEREEDVRQRVSQVGTSRGPFLIVSFSKQYQF